MGNLAKRKDYKKGFTLSELMIASLILAFALVGLLSLFISCSFINENSRNSSLAYNALQMKMEELSNENYLSLDSFNVSPNNEFPLNGFSAGRGKGKITVINDPSVLSGLKRISIQACYKNRKRLVGDATLLGDDIISCQSSPVELITSIAEP